MPWPEGELMGGQTSCVSHVGVWWALQRTHKTLRADAETEREQSGAGRGSVQADSEGEGEGLVTLNTYC